MWNEWAIQSPDHLSIYIKHFHCLEIVLISNENWKSRKLICPTLCGDLFSDLTGGGVRGLISPLNRTIIARDDHFRKLAKVIYRLNSLKSENSPLLLFSWFSLKMIILTIGLKIKNLKFLGIQSSFEFSYLLTFCRFSAFKLEVQSKNKNPAKRFDFRLVHADLLVDCIVNRFCHRWLQKSTIVSLYSWSPTVGDMWWDTVGDITFATWHKAFILDFLCFGEPGIKFETNQRLNLE